MEKVTDSYSELYMRLKKIMDKQSVIEWYTFLIHSVDNQYR